VVDASLSPQPPLPPPRRGPIRDSERTRAAILAAATEEFARHGLGGARVERIAVRARTNKRMLYYYFRSKDDLFLAVLEGAYDRIRSAEKELSLLDVPPEEGVRRLVRFTWEYYLANPEFLTLLHTENLHGASHLKRSSAARALNSPLIETLERVLQRGVAEGVFRDDVDALQLYISIAGLAYFYLGNNHTLSAVFGRDLARPGARRERLAHMVDVITGYLRPLPAPVDGEAAPRR
jgi:AcrR family transcriptional regulator